MTAESLLVVASHSETRSSIALALSQAGYRVATCVDSTAALARMSVEPCALMIVECAERPGEVAALLEQMKSDAALAAVRTIVLLSGAPHGGAVRFLECGADDAQPLPAESGELIARVRTCLSRPAAQPACAPLRIGNLVLDTDRFRILAGDSVIDISRREFQLMHFFIRNRGVVHSRERLLERVWSDQHGISPRTVDTHVRRLRVALQRVGCEHYLQTVRGVGYRFSPRVGANKTQPSSIVAGRRTDGFDTAEQSAT